MPQIRRWLPAGALVLVGLVVAGLILSRVGRRTPPEAPPLPDSAEATTPFQSPFRNVQADVKYVGDQACAGCHRSYVRSYHAHSMGRSFAPVADASALEHYDAAAGAVFELKGMRLSVERREQRVFHKVTYLDAAGKPIPEVEAEAEVHYVMGSGTQGRSYLLDRDGYLFQSPISWFQNKKSWGVSPGYERSFMHFHRPIMPRCVFCHCNEAEPVKGTVNQYTTPVFRSHAIGCERCHGPGELHVAARMHRKDADGVDHTIVNPRHLEPTLRDAVCQQCHLQGEIWVARRDRQPFDYRPGTPLHDAFSVFVRPPERTENYKAVSHVEQMHVSTCFIKSAGKLGCISCHDPHRLPGRDERVAYYRSACVKCHDEAACHGPAAERRQKEDSCAECHMPRSAVANVAHAALTDHRIVRSPNRPPQPKSGLRPGDIPLLLFHRDLVRAADPERERDLGLALAEVAKEPSAAEIRGIVAERALPLLEAAVRRSTQDVAAWEGKGYVLWARGRREEALASLQQALEQFPKRENALGYATQIAVELGRLDAALDYARRLMEVNPWHPSHATFLAHVHAQREEWSQALAACKKALQLNPAGVEARSVLVSYHLQQGDRASARRELERMITLDPARERDLRRWFEERTR